MQRHWILHVLLTLWSAFAFTGKEIAHRPNLKTTVQTLMHFTR